MEKIKLFIDFDGTIANSNKAVCDLYNEEYSSKEDFVRADYTKIKTWGFLDQCTLLKENEIIKYFSMKKLFNILELNDDVLEVLNVLKEDFDIYIVTIGTQKNINLKTTYIEKYLKGFKTIYIYNGDNCEMNKSTINMNDGILIDDHISNLDSSSASMKFVFGLETDYNKSDYIRMENWTEGVVLMEIANKLMTDIDVLGEDENEYWKEVRESI